MEYLEHSLDDCLSEQKLQINDIVDLSAQIIEAVGILSESGVVHRDLKPGNILLNEEKRAEGSVARRIKVIDFAESALMSESFESASEEQLGSTMPYSPI